jgi:peptidoglycan/LPS O-acetylase OafA/YrhL
LASSGGDGRATYRPDIDGLRAVAVLPVLLFHAGIAPFGGGFVGVDVFFVISGYLITLLILRETADGRFSYWGFLERRARRLVPAAVVVVAASLAAGWFLLIPDHFTDLGRSVTYFNLLAANHFFLGQAGYFAEAQPAPLLHTWSLSVEEQFYLVYSLALLVLVRFGRGPLATGIGVALLLSLAISVWLVRTGRQDAAFYLTASRFWELLAGAVLALGLLPRPGPRTALALRLIGLALIVLAVFGYGRTTAFPGLAALPPVMGAAMLIHAGSAGRVDVVHRLLSAPAMVWIGKRSYGLYLWHWPLLVYAGLLAPSRPGWVTWSVLALSLALAALSYRFVETPVRRGWTLPRRSRLFAATVAAASLSVIAGVVIDGADGLPERLPKEVRTVYAFVDQLSGDHVERCLYRRLDRQTEPCLLGKAGDEGRADFVLWGDSFAYAARSAYDALALDMQLTGLLVTYAACPPLLDIGRSRDPADACAAHNTAAATRIRESGAKLVLMQANWQAYEAAAMLVPTAGFHPPLEAAHRPLPAPANDAQRLFRDAVAATVERLAGQGNSVALVDPTPVHDASVPNAVAVALLFGRSAESVAMPRSRYLTKNAYPLALFDALDEQGLAMRVPLTEVFCPRDPCLVLADDGVALFADESHFTLQGAALLKDPLIPAFLRLTPGRS